MVWSYDAIQKWHDHYLEYHVPSCSFWITLRTSVRDRWIWYHEVSILYLFFLKIVYICCFHEVHLVGYGGSPKRHETVSEHRLLLYSFQITSNEKQARPQRDRPLPFSYTSRNTTIKGEMTCIHTTSLK